MAVRSVPIRVHMQGDCQVENITWQVQEAVGQQAAGRNSHPVHQTHDGRFPC